MALATHTDTSSTSATTVLTLLAVRAGDPSLLGDAWPLAGRFAGVGAFDG